MLMSYPDGEQSFNSVQYKLKTKKLIFDFINTALFTSWWLQHIVHCGGIITVSSVLAADGVH